MGRPNVGLKKLSAARPSSALSLNRLRTSRSNSKLAPGPRRSNVRDNRMSTSVCEDKRRVPARLELNPHVALRQRHERRGRPWLAAEMVHVGRDDEPCARKVVYSLSPRSMCGRLFGSRPSAFVRLFGSWPNVRNRPADEMYLTCDAAALDPLAACRPDLRLDHVYDRVRLPAAGPRFLSREHEPVVGH